MTKKINISEVYNLLYKKFQGAKYGNSSSQNYRYKAISEILYFGRIKYHFYLEHHMEKDKIRCSIDVKYKNYNENFIGLYSSFIKFDSSFQEKEFTNKIKTTTEKVQIKLKKIENKYCREYMMLKLINHHFKFQHQ